jgi:Eco57I restriction-modification methylase
MTVEKKIHEVDFCGQIASQANILFNQDPAAYAFTEARLEGFGSGSASRKRKDLRFFDPDGKLALCGEVKLPGTPKGRSPYDDEIYQDAAQKADNAGVRFFFTWNVNIFVLWDRSLWDKPILERRAGEWKLGRQVSSPEEVANPENLEFIRTRFLPALLVALSDIYSGRKLDWFMPPDDIFIQSLGSRLDWPVQLTSEYLSRESNQKKFFDQAVQRWLTDQDWPFIREVPEEWYKALNNMAKTLAYVWANRIIFYNALRARFADLPQLKLKRSVKTSDDALRVFNSYFKEAVDRSGDYEPLMFPNERDWATDLVFRPASAIDAWRGLLRGIESVDFKKVPSDVVGRIFQKLIGPAERHRYGQHFTGDDVVDLINAFCIRDGASNLLDPACGSGSFLVRAYYRKRFLSPARTHKEQLAGLFGCDISLYPAHLATLNLAAREINEEANYPRIVRRNFFDTNVAKPFCEIPVEGGGKDPIALPPLDAVVGNPPYVRQEKMEGRDKKRYGTLVTRAWPDLKLSGRSDLHCYFWPIATHLLKANGFFGFLTSSSWMDVEYGFRLQSWILSHFRLLAVMESAGESWFPDARVKTAILIAQRCDDEEKRMANRVRFVRFDKTLNEIIGVDPNKDEARRQQSVERLRDTILSADEDIHGGSLRIIVKRQSDLWNDGVRASSFLRDIAEADTTSEEGEVEQSEPNNESGNIEPLIEISEGSYAAGKWGRYVRAPDFYFQVMRRFGESFVPLGEVARIRRGITSGCDAFFMPRDISEQILRQDLMDKEFRERSGGAARKEVQSGDLRIIRAGDGSIHPIEARWLVPEVHTLRNFDRLVMHPKDIDRVVLVVGESMSGLQGTWARKYLKYGERATFPSKKSKAVAVPQRSTCAARDPWYDLTRLIRPGFAFWPKGQQYRHIVVENPGGYPCNSRVYYLESAEGVDKSVLVAILNSTLVGFWRNFYGRYTGIEGAMETMVVDASMIEVPDPRSVDSLIGRKLRAAFARLRSRRIGDFAEEQLMNCHSPERARRLASGPLILSSELRQDDRRALDDAIFELFGVRDSSERSQFVDRLYEETARHFRSIRVVEIVKNEENSRSSSLRFSVYDLAADVWDAAELEDTVALADWLRAHPKCVSSITIPDDRPARLSRLPIFEPGAVYFGKTESVSMTCRSGEAAVLVLLLANHGLSGTVRIPTGRTECAGLTQEIEVRLESARTRFTDLAESRIGDPSSQSLIVDQMMHWFVHGRAPAAMAVSSVDGADAGETKTKD